VRPLVESLERRAYLAATKILPLGDSITEGWGDNSRVSYRFWLGKKLQLAGYDFDFVGGRTGINSNPPIYSDWDQHHEGHSGWFAEQVAAQATSYASSSQADIVLLHIGTNDIANGQSVSSTITDIGNIIDNLRVARPNVTILLAKIIPLAGFPTQINQLNTQIGTLATAKNTPASPVSTVDQHTGFSVTLDTFDGIHPISRGERKMSNKWYAALTTILPAPPPPAPPAVTYLSDLNWTSMSNGFGPVERDQSIGPDGADDGGAIWINGITYAKGLGTHANAEIVYDLNGAYARFVSQIGIDDGASSPPASAVFEVWVDGAKLFDSGVMNGASPTQSIDINVAGKNTLRLVSADGGNGADWDHADWAMARLTTQPTVASSAFHYNSAPHSLHFTFRGNVSASLGTADLLLENLTTSQTVPAASMALAYNGTSDTATFTFPGFASGILPDGRYRATIAAAGVIDAAGNPMPADHSFDFQFMIGDANNNGIVNLEDFDILASNFGATGSNFSQGDFNYDTQVNLLDFNLLAGGFGGSILGPDSSPLSGKPSASHAIDLVRDATLDRV
jgi:lysophospholipase L1-like esterase